MNFKRPARRLVLGAALASALAAALVSSTAAAVKVSFEEDIFIDVRLLLQPWVELKVNPAVAPPGDEFTNDFFLRRTRIVLGGQITKWVSFFVDTDMPNWGRNGNWSLVNVSKDAAGEVTGVTENTSFFVQDAWVSFDIHESFHIDAGMLLLPFVHFSRQSAATLHTIDYHVDLLRYPPGSDKVWRNTGVELRGLLLRRKIDYRVALTNGVADNVETIPAKRDAAGAVIVPAVVSRTHDAPRLTGRVAYNFFEAEDGFFLNGTYLGLKKILSVGLAFDFQPQVFGARDHYYAFGGDVFLDLPLSGGKRRLSGQLDVLYYGGDHNPRRGFGLAMDIGYAFGPWEPILSFDYFRPETAPDLEGSLLGMHGELAWWFIGHSVNVKLDVGLVKPETFDLDDLTFLTTIQTQLFF